MEGGTLDEKEEARMKGRRFREPRRAVAGVLSEVGGYLHAMRALGGVHPMVHRQPPFPCLKEKRKRKPVILLTWSNSHLSLFCTQCQKWHNTAHDSPTQWPPGGLFSSTAIRVWFHHFLLGYIVILASTSQNVRKKT